MEDGAGMARRRSQPPHPQIQAREEGAGVARRRGKSPAERASLPDVDDILREILVRLSPQPSSLPRASAVCKRWQGIVTDPKFHRQFRAHHRKPPLLGFFCEPDRTIVFTSVMEPPDRIPPERFDLGRYSRNLGYSFLDCRHGLVLFKSYKRNEVAVCDPITGHHRCLAIPSEFGRGYEGAVLCPAAAGDHGHVHDGCQSGPFKVVLACLGSTANQPLALVCVYSSETGVWGDLIASAAPCERLYVCDPATMVGNALYWLPKDGRNRLVEFDLDGQSLAAIQGPTVTNDLGLTSRRIIQGEVGVVGFAILSLLVFQTWQRNVNDHGIATWVPWNTIETHTILGHPPSSFRLLGYDEDNGVMFLNVSGSVYKILLMSMQSRKVYETLHAPDHYPFSSFYTPDDCSSLSFSSH